MILKNKKLLVITSLLTLLPIPVGLLLWEQFPETIAVHFGFTGRADGFAGIPFTVLGLPLMMLGVHWLCVFFTALDKGNRDRNQKMFRIVLWAIPILSNLSLLGIYALALGLEFSPVAWTMIPMGLLFAVMGNYMPKTRMNSTMGIKIYWTYTSEANWNATHRFAGKLWVVGGVLIALCALLPHGWAVGIMLALIAPLVAAPMIYSWRFYKKEVAEGKELKHPLRNKKSTRLTIAFVIVLIVFLSVVLFYGDINYQFREDYLFVESNMYSDYLIYYDTINSLEYREGNVSGLRVGGYGSFRLLLGWFENKEFGTYVRYTYYNPESCIVLTAKDQTIVLSCETAEETQALYEQLQQYVN
jgi:uncharacterized membrane protein